MTAGELIGLLRTANPRATVVFLSCGAEEGEVGEVDAVAVLAENWTRERLTVKGRLYVALYPQEPREELQTQNESEHIAVDSIAVVVLASDAGFLNSQRFT